MVITTQSIYIYVLSICCICRYRFYVKTVWIETEIRVEFERHGNRLVKKGNVITGSRKGASMPSVDLQAGKTLEVIIASKCASFASKLETGIEPATYPLRRERSTN